MRRLLGPVALAAACLAVTGGGAIAALADEADPPPDRPLAGALERARTAPRVPGVQARISFANRLTKRRSTPSAGPLATGATGRFWAGSDGRWRLELQSPRGDAQITHDGRALQLYDARSDTLAVVRLPARDGSRADERGARSSPAALRSVLALLRADARPSEALGVVVAGRPAYEAQAAPRRDGGLLRAVRVAWDAATGVPLRAALLAGGGRDPVVQVEATDVAFGPVDPSTLSPGTHPGARRIDVDLRNAAAAASDRPASAAAVARAVPFAVRAPDSLAGRRRTGVRLVRAPEGPLALSVYGKGLDGLVVLERRARPEDRPAVIETALGTLVRSTRGGVTRIVIGSARAAQVRAAAGSL